ncbi:hypothetical protein ZOSMA_307G00090 [Zostera marina]|uniref:Uncharacterized protein n=1 Tax=Zostera marina TaxID=29655 RepID=A0A0K9PCC5_ZOSMR|nr:hypothetical protein ZOSMA_307G00090 [Zostera marina]
MFSTIREGWNVRSHLYIMQDSQWNQKKKITGFYYMYTNVICKLTKV